MSGCENFLFFVCRFDCFVDYWLCFLRIKGRFGGFIVGYKIVLGVWWEVISILYGWLVLEVGSVRWRVVIFGSG